ncbi:4'-phosphopantetheinyl transferase family protein [Psychromonas sp. PT13]|uniref:4'-phosphopantetheinyl transferase family protein n=1 Tax=Psychromonas sp. PT13 TaxID=3439547 RepID=UPI003EC0B533
MFFDVTIPKQQLTSNDVHLWTITPDKISSLEQLSALKSLLSQAEIEKILNYRQHKSQHTAIITRAFVRTVLALYLDCQPHELEFTINKHGKPALSNTSVPLKFNLSHNDQLIICSVCLAHDIGCDVENISRKISIDSIAKRYFSNQEATSLLSLPIDKKQQRFFEYWTLKEAFVKAMGIGISFGLDTFSFHINSSATATFNDNITLSMADKHALSSDAVWYHCLIYPDSDHCIAISVNPKTLGSAINITQFNADNF